MWAYTLTIVIYLGINVALKVYKFLINDIKQEEKKVDAADLLLVTGFMFWGIIALLT